MGNGKRWRDAITGRYTAVRDALARPDTTVGESTDQAVTTWARQAFVFLVDAEFATAAGEQRASQVRAAAPSAVQRSGRSKRR
jgi:hypothetical protein